MKVIFLTLIASHLIAQNIYQSGDTLFITSKVVIVQTSDFNVQIDMCPACDDQLTPGIAVLLDSCIRDEEWLGTYNSHLPDSASFFLPETMNFFETLGVFAADDCAVDTFFVEDLEIIPPGGVDRPVGGTKEFRIKLKAIDATGKEDEETMIWIRDNSGCI